MYLLDSAGRKYDSSTAGMFSDGFFRLLDSLNPSVKKRGLVAFDVPSDQEYTLLVSGGFRSGDEAIVPLAQAPLLERQ
jgi:hypothetical protein